MAKFHIVCNFPLKIREINCNRYFIGAISKRLFWGDKQLCLYNLDLTDIIWISVMSYKEWLQLLEDPTIETNTLLLDRKALKIDG